MALGDLRREVCQVKIEFGWRRGRRVWWFTL
jgi:hypothetical protein